MHRQNDSWEHWKRPSPPHTLKEDPGNRISTVSSETTGQPLKEPLNGLQLSCCLEESFTPLFQPSLRLNTPHQTPDSRILISVPSSAWKRMLTATIEHNRPLSNQETLYSAVHNQRQAHDSLPGQALYHWEDQWINGDSSSLWTWDNEELFSFQTTSIISSNGTGIRGVWWRGWFWYPR